MTMIAMPVVARCRKHVFEKQKCWCDVRHLRCAYCGKPKSKEYGWGSPTKSRR